MTANAALVTGAGDRLGKAMALSLGAAGYAVAVHYNSSADKARAVADAIIAQGGAADVFPANLSDEGDTASLIARARDALGPLRLLVNSASLFEADDIDDMTRATWDAHLDTNLRAPLKLAQDFVSQIDETADNLIVNLIDQRVWKLTPQFLSYTTSKAALWTVTQTLAQALGPRSVRVNAIGPGPTMRNKRQSEDDWRKQNEATVLGRGATPDDIVAALHYLIAAKAVTGQMIAIDGGQHLAWQTPDVMVNE
ncbi:MAG: SDR family oxidoreductase [Pseudomonadota bacterium]